MDQKPTIPKSKSRYDVVRIAAVAVELAAHILAGYILLTHFSQYLPVAVGIYLLASAAIAVLWHIARTHRA